MQPDDANVYEWMYDQQTQSWKRWMDTIPEYRCDPDMAFASIIVPTADTVRWAARLVSSKERDHCTVEQDQTAGHELCIMPYDRTVNPNQALSSYWVLCRPGLCLLGQDEPHHSSHLWQRMAAHDAFSFSM